MHSVLTESSEEGSDDEMAGENDSDVSKSSQLVPFPTLGGQALKSDHSSHMSCHFLLQENWDEEDEKEESDENDERDELSGDEQEMAIEKEINGESDLDPENESEEE